MKHLHLTSGELKQYLNQTEKLMQRYSQRLEWLLTGTTDVFIANNVMALFQNIVICLHRHHLGEAVPEGRQCEEDFSQQKTDSMKAH